MAPQQHQPIITASLAIFAVGALCYLFRSKGVAVWQKARLDFFAVLHLLFVILLICYVALEKELFATALMVLAFSAFLGINVLLVLLPMTLSMLQAADRVVRVYVWLTAGIASILVVIILVLGGLQWRLSGVDWIWVAIDPLYFASCFLSAYCAATTMCGPIIKTHRFNAMIHGISGLASVILAASYAVWPHLLHHRHLDLQGCVAVLDVFFTCWGLEGFSWPSWPSRTSAADADSISRNSTASSCWGDWRAGLPPPIRQTDVEVDAGAGSETAGSRGSTRDTPMANVSTQYLV